MITIAIIFIAVMYNVKKFMRWALKQERAFKQAWNLMFGEL